MKRLGTFIVLALVMSFLCISCSNIGTNKGENINSNDNANKMEGTNKQEEKKFDNVNSKVADAENNNDSTGIDNQVANDISADSEISSDNKGEVDKTNDSYFTVLSNAGRKSVPILPNEINENFLLKYYQFVENTTKKLASSKENENLLYAPFSYYVALSELAEISSGEAKKELENVLYELENYNNIDITRHAIDWLKFSRFVDMMGRSKSSGRFNANTSLWLNEGIITNFDKVNTLKDSFDADVFVGDFANNEYQNRMYYWQYEKSNYCMTPDYDEAHKIMDANAIASVSSMEYFDSWLRPFDIALSKDDAFLAKDSELMTSFMNANTGVSMTSGEGYRACRLNLQEYNSMYVLLPDEGTSVYDLLNREGFLASFLAARNDIQSDINEEKCEGSLNISLPKFSLENKIDLVDISKELGIEKIFNKGELSFVEFANDKTFVDRFNQSSKLSVDEKGISTTNYANEQFIGGPQGVIEEDFVVNRPFIFIMIKDKVPFYVGIVENPLEK